MPDPLETIHLALPYLAPSQAQKHVTHNEALRRLDFLVQIAVEATGATTPPASPAEGDRYLLGTGAAGAWLGQDNNIAAFTDGSWWFATPQIGWLTYDKAAAQLLVLKPSGWTVVA